jgi:RNA polymerase sigma-70 factor (ECF subfamily)
LPDTARNPTSDEALIASFVERGDEGAMRTLVERHQQRIFGFLVGMVRDREVANDLFQETFFRILSALRSERASYTDQGRFLGWAMRIARNAALDHLRSRGRWADVDQAGSEDGTSYWDRLTDDAPSAEQTMHREDQREWLRESIDRLPPDQREVVLLRHESELTFREIAELTGVSINTALGRMRYALINLRRMIPTEEIRTAES